MAFHTTLSIDTEASETQSQPVSQTPHLRILNRYRELDAVCVPSALVVVGSTCVSPPTLLLYLHDIFACSEKRSERSRVPRLYPIWKQRWIWSSQRDQTPAQFFANIPLSRKRHSYPDKAFKPHSNSQSSRKVLWAKNRMGRAHVVLQSARQVVRVREEVVLRQIDELEESHVPLLRDLAPRVS